MCLYFPRISLVVPLVEWAKALARAALDAIVDCFADAGRFAADTFLPSWKVKQPLGSLTARGLGSRHAAVLAAGIKSLAFGLYDYINSTVARWVGAAKATSVSLLRRATFIAASPLIILNATSRLLFSGRGLFFFERVAGFLWKGLLLGSLVPLVLAREVATRSVRRAALFLIGGFVLSCVLVNLALSNARCNGDSLLVPSLSTPSVLLEQGAFEDTFAEEDTLVLSDETFEPAKATVEDKGCEWACGFSWADDAEEEEANQTEVVYFFPRKEEAPVESIPTLQEPRTLYSIPEEVEEEFEEELVSFEASEEKVEQSSGSDSDDITLCEILVTGLNQDEEEFAVHESEPVLEDVHKGQHDDETTLVVSSKSSDLDLFEDDNDINVKLPIVSFFRPSIPSQSSVFGPKDDLLLVTTWTPDLGLPSEPFS